MFNRKGSEGPLNQKSFQLAIRVVNLNKFLIDEKREFIMSKQITRSGTSIGAMVRESENAESGKDFIHKLSVAQKEANETLYWLDLLFATDYLPEKAYQSLCEDTIEVLKMLTSSIKTKKKNLL